MIALSATARGTKELSRLLGGNAKKLKREIAVAVNATAKSTVSAWAKEVSDEVATAQKNIKKTIKVTKKAAGFFSTTPSAVVKQKETARIPLRDFKARQTNAGVTYRIAKSGKPAKIPGAFIVQSFGGHVFTRIGAKVKATKGRYKGRMRQRIDKKYGPSPWGVSLRNDIKQKLLQPTEAKLIEEINKRIRFLKLKQSGAI